jgi:hypothetical protein
MLVILKMDSHTGHETSDEKMTACLHSKFVKLICLLLQIHHLNSLAMMEVSYAWFTAHRNPTNQIHGYNEHSHISGICESKKKDGIGEWRICNGQFRKGKY